MNNIAIGLLDAVGNISVKNNSDSIHISWSPPFSLDVTGVDPDIWYTVLISNVTDENNPVNVSCTNCHNVTQPHYSFTTENSSPSHKYSFTVIPLNGAGQGERSGPVMGEFRKSKSLTRPIRSLIRLAGQGVWSNFQRECDWCGLCAY